MMKLRTVKKTSFFGEVVMTIGTIRHEKEMISR